MPDGQGDGLARQLAGAFRLAFLQAVAQAYVGVAPVTTSLPPDPSCIDHMRALVVPEYRAKAIERLLRAEPGLDWVAMHEANGACCRLQPWPMTYAVLIAEVAARRPKP